MHKTRKRKRSKKKPKWGPKSRTPQQKKRHTIANPRDYEKIQRFRKQLPVYGVKEAFLELYDSNDIVFVVGETGCGKTTQIPQFLYEHHVKKGKKTPGICVTEPRRIAAMKVSKRVNEEMYDLTKLKSLVGFKVRFQNSITPETCLFFLTDGMLLREIQEDPLLEKYDVVIVDEAHERSLHTEILLGLLRNLVVTSKSHRSERRRKRKLKLVVMSATLEIGTFSNFFRGVESKTLYISGRMFDIKVRYLERNLTDTHDGVVNSVLQVHVDSDPGDILVFLHGSDQIEELYSILEEKSKYVPSRSLRLIVTRLYSNLAWRKQSEVFDETPKGCRKVILSTNIAETSVTIPGVKYVIDSGLVKVNHFNPKTRSGALVVELVTKSAARQRMGRAGREMDGTCFRLYTEQTFLDMQEFPVPEVLRANLAGVVLQLLDIGVSDVYSFPFMEKPNKIQLDESVQILKQIGAVKVKMFRNRNKLPVVELTKAGRNMAKFPLDPLYTRVMLSARKYSCVKEVVSIVSMLCVENHFNTPVHLRKEANEAKMKFSSVHGDHIMLLKVFDSHVDTVRNLKGNSVGNWHRQNFLDHKKLNEVRKIRGQLVEYLRQVWGSGFEEESCEGDFDKVKMCFLEGFFFNVAFVTEKRGILRTSGGIEVKIHPSSCLGSRMKDIQCVVYNSLIKTNNVYIRELMTIRSEWLEKFKDKLNKPRKPTFSMVHPQVPRVQVSVVKEEVKGSDGNVRLVKRMIPSLENDVQRFDPVETKKEDVEREEEEFAKPAPVQREKPRKPVVEIVPLKIMPNSITLDLDLGQRKDGDTIPSWGTIPMQIPIPTEPFGVPSPDGDNIILQTSTNTVISDKTPEVRPRMKPKPKPNRNLDEWEVMP